MPYFNQDYLRFFRELEQNNNKEWFDENRKRYENTVKKPFRVFADDLTVAMQRLYPDHELSNSVSIKRINRDIRFSKDKTPYKDNMGVSVNPYGKKVHYRPGFFMQANHKDVRVYSGIFGLDKEQLYAVRQHIDYNLDEFEELINAGSFKKTFGTILGDRNKRLPSEFQETLEKQPLIANKDFYWFFKLPPETILQDNLIDELISRYRHTLDVNRFFVEALDE